ncbi:MocR-like transcription factor YczR [Pengzhenrongella sicca]|uniref:PLP-dependent aminotransferase family protein n=1 Tax=Pengzhenrongella sicca TaxID=2819238 RepID=A0A8A4ZES6_9MICO|nr:PLP-dependent aminotransferase family protein [Pengzhenrongella sicca]QTE28198.1 PLP-dependent aminotransferase family protein [Pengzhenrongella sicca]
MNSLVQADPAVFERRMATGTLVRLLGSWRHAGPAYLALAAGIRRAVLDGTLPLRTRLPSERELADALGLSRTTTSSAYQHLRDGGLLVSRRGSGTVTTLPSQERAAAAAGGAPGVVAGARDVVDLTIAASPSPPGLHLAYVAALTELPRYLAGPGYHYLGLDVLRAAVAAEYSSRGTPTSPDEILITSGAQQALSLLLSTVVGPGDRVVVEHPTYSNAIATVRSVGARAVPVPVGRGGLDVDLLESTVRQTSPRAVYLIPDHHNPTGLSLDAEARTRVREIARRYRTLVIGDETLTELTLDGERPGTFLGAAPAGALVAIGSTAKAFWGGLRVGWIRGSRELVARLARERARDDLSTPVLEQLVAEQLLTSGAEILLARRAAVRAQRDGLIELVGRLLPTWQVSAPAGGLSLWVHLGWPASSALAAVAPQHGVRVAPGPSFGVDGSFEDRLRLPFGQPLPEAARGIEALAAAWRSLRLDGAGSPGQPAPGTTAFGAELGTAV